MTVADTGNTQPECITEELQRVVRPQGYTRTACQSQGQVSHHRR